MTAVPVTELLPATDLPPDAAAGQLIAKYHGNPGWLDAFVESLERRRSGQELDRVLRTWGLSQSEAGRLFGVSRQAVAKWLRDGVPGERVESVANVAAATDVLTHYLKRDRIPAVVRREATNLDGRSLLDLLATGQTEVLLQKCRAMFAFTDVHR